MGYRSDVRLVVSREGYKELREFVKKEAMRWAEPDGYSWDMIEIADSIKFKDNGDQVMICWQAVKWYEGSFKDVDIIMAGIRLLRDKGYSYSFSRIGEDYDDIEEYHYEGELDQEVDWPWICRYFDDEGLGFEEVLVSER